MREPTAPCMTSRLCQRRPHYYAFTPWRAAPQKMSSR